jgi:hypothetical protein
MSKRVVILALLASAAGCELIANIPSYGSRSSDGGTSDDDAMPSGDDAMVSDDAMTGDCTTNAQCTTLAEPTCDNHVCRACRTDADCGTNGVCMLDGTCAADARIMYASPTGSGTVCSAAAPCTLEQGVALLSATKDVLKLAAATFQLTAALSIRPSVPVLVAGEGATIVGAGGTPSFTIETNGPDTKVTGVTIDQNTWYAGYCEAGKVTYSRTTWMNGGLGFFSYNTPCDFTLEYSIVRTQAAYAASFTAADSTIHVRNSMFVLNSTNGGGNPVFSVGSTNTTAAFENTTFANNGALPISCQPGNTVRSSISFGNPSPPSNTCVVSYSDIEGGYGGANDHNVTLNPLFVSATDFHLQPTSPVRGLGDPANVLPFDIDLQPRPQPAATAPDLGADEVP